MSDPTYPAERHVKVPEDWFKDNDPETYGGTGGTYYIKPRQGSPAVSHVKTNFVCAGVIIGRCDGDEDANYAVINGWLHGESENECDTYRLALGVAHPLRFAGFRFNNTSARSIRFIGE